MVEKIILSESGERYSQCIKGKRACPRENVGGVLGYAGFLDAIQNPKHKEHRAYMEWIGGEFDAEAFDLDIINQNLRRVK